MTILDDEMYRLGYYYIIYKYLYPIHNEIITRRSSCAHGRGVVPWQHLARRHRREHHISLVFTAEEFSSLKCIVRIFL